MSFAEQSIASAREYVRTVAFVDDHAFEEKREESTAQLVKATEEIIKLGKSVSSKQSTVPKAEPQTPPVRKDDYIEERIDSRAVVHGFAKEGLICSLLKPSKGGIIEDEILAAARIADLVVLDWDLYDDQGVAAREYAKRLISLGDDQARVRVVVIYTGDKISSLAKIISSLFDSLGGVAAGYETKGAYVIQRNHCRIAIYAKSKLGGERAVSEENLPEKLIEEFSQLSRGLLSNAVLSCIGRLRDQTPRLLAKFSPDLDDAYLLHRMLLEAPSEAEDHVLPLISDEVRAIIDSSDWQKGLQHQAICSFIDEAETKKIARLVSLFNSNKEPINFLKDALGASAVSKDFREKLHKDSKIKKFKRPTVTGDGLNRLADIYDDGKRLKELE